MEPWLVTICTMAAGRGELGGSSWGRRRRPATRPLWSPAPRLPPPPGCLGLLRKHGREEVWAGVAGGGQSGSRIPSSRAGGADWPATEFSAEGQLVSAAGQTMADFCGDQSISAGSLKRGRSSLAAPHWAAPKVQRRKHWGGAGCRRHRGAPAG